MSVIPKVEGKRVYRTLKGRKTDQWDVIIIGSGMGGMCCATTLARYGKKVLLLEKHSIPGGFTHMFRRGNFAWDVGVHAIGEMSKKFPVGRLLNWLGDGKIQMNPIGSPYEKFFWPNFEINFPDSKEKFLKTVQQKFPQEKEQINRYFNLTEKVAKDAEFLFIMKSLPKIIGAAGRKCLKIFKRDYWSTTTKEVMDELSLSKTLQTVLSAQCGYYGAVPSESSFAIHALIHKHFWNGAYYPAGGAKEIATHLLKVVEDQGGETICGAEVEAVLVEKNRAYGVRLKSGEELFAKKIISGTSAKLTIKKFIPPSYRKTQWAKSICSEKNSPPYICLNMSFKGDITAAGASSANCWFNSNWRIKNNLLWDIESKTSIADLLYLSFPSLKDLAHNPGKDLRHTGECITFVPWNAFEKWKESEPGRRAKQYQEFKEEIQQRLITQLKAYIPEIMKLMVRSELSTPLTAHYYCGAEEGAIYGLESTPQRYNNEFLRSRTPIKNFYMTGVDTMSIGVTGAMVSGVMTAAAIDPRVYGKLIKLFYF